MFLSQKQVGAIGLALEIAFGVPQVVSEAALHYAMV